MPFDETRILSSAGALRLGVVPQRLGIVGAGAIGLEMASVWRRLGADVTLLEAQPEFLGAADEQIAREALKAYTKQGLRIELGVSIGSVASGRFGVTVNHAGSDGRARALNVDQLASELIAEGVIAMQRRLRSDELARICHAHPTLGEATKEAALAVQGRALNF